MATQPLARSSANDSNAQNQLRISPLKRERERLNTKHTDTLLRGCFDSALFERTSHTKHTDTQLRAHFESALSKHTDTLLNLLGSTIIPKCVNLKL